MARPVTVGSFQAMQRGESDAAGDRQISTGNVDPSTSAIVSAEPPLTVPEQLRLLEIRKFSADTPLDEVVKRLRARADLLGIPAIDEEIAAEATRRTGETAATVDEAVAAAADAPLYAEAPEVTASEYDAGDLAGLHRALGLPGEPSVAVELEPDDQPDALTRLVARELPLLDVGARCTAEMSLHMITERVRDAALETDWGKLATDAEIVAEAERIWVSLDRQRSHTYSVEQDGTIRDWRRPDTTPDRGDVTTVHTITDETEQQRFSGGGADDAQQQSLFLVPNDQQFNGKLYRDAPELANLAEKLIGQHGFLEALVNCEIRYYWRRKTGVSKGRVKIGYCKRASDLLGHFSGADFIIWLSATTARDGKFTDQQVEAALFHQLLHIETDDEGNFISVRHDFEGFAQEIRHYGTWTEDLKVGGQAVVAAQQLGLLDAIDEGIDDDEDDDEGEELEASGFSTTDEAEDEDAPADPDAEYDDDDDPLADHDV